MGVQLLLLLMKICVTVNYLPVQGSAAPHHYKATSPPSIALAPAMSSSKGHTKKSVHGSPSVLSNLFWKHHHARNKFINFAPEPSYLASTPTHSQKGLSQPPVQAPLPSSMGWGSPASVPRPTISSSHYNIPAHPPTISPFGPSLKKTKSPPPSSVLALPSPPPNKDCASVKCIEPLTYSPPGSPCACVWPIQVKLQLGVALYTFFPLVSELSKEIAASVSLSHSQVWIMGANSANEQLDETTVLINLIPSGIKFNDTVAFSTYQKFWHKQVSIKASLFGAYEVVYVRYPGLPPSPPSAPSVMSTIDDGPNHGRTVKPLGVDVPRRKKDGLDGRMIAVIVLSSFAALIVCMGFVWVLLLKCRACLHHPGQDPHALMSSSAKPLGPTWSRMFGSMPSSASISFNSSALTYTGSAKSFTLNDMERVTKNFDASRIVGEGGFGVVYRGSLDDGRAVAVKVLKRDDQHSGREFLAEVEMLSRLHHRNLVKLIGICTEDHTRCLVYELIPNGSVESHLHGADKGTDPLDWDARMKIALGSARGLAYLHEDSSPCVIHRDFKSSNILLEHDFTPKVSDFGLARAASDEGNKHISTHVMGTFGYLAPEYAMTGHLLVKSDVYSYGVVLLELLTGRKPVDLSQPPGQENLVAWVRPLLTSKEGLETIIDPTIKSDISFDSVSKVAAIASMCVQPVVSHRPFMGEVVQALKLVCNEFNEAKGPGSRSYCHKDFSVYVDSKISRVSGELEEVPETSPHPMPGSNSRNDTQIEFSSTSDVLSTSVGLESREFESFRRHSSSGPLIMGRGRQVWQRLRSLSRGSMSEHEFIVFDNDLC